MMDATVAAALTTGLTTFKADAMTQVSSALTLAIPVAVTLGLTFLGWRLFRAFAHV